MGGGTMLAWDDDTPLPNPPEPERHRSIVLLRVLAVLLILAVLGPLYVPEYAIEIRALCWFMAALVCGAGAVWGEGVP